MSGPDSVAICRLIFQFYNFDPEPHGEGEVALITETHATR